MDSFLPFLECMFGVFIRQCDMCTVFLRMNTLLRKLLTNSYASRVFPNAVTERGYFTEQNDDELCFVER